MSRYGYGYYGGYSDWAPYVPVAERRRRAMKKMDALRKEGVDIQPIQIEGRKIAKTFWGEAWCGHLESFSDYENRLPRGRTYVRNGSVCHLAMNKGIVEAKVSGSEVYDVKVTIKTLPGAKWILLKTRCSGQIGSLLELLQGRLSDHVMAVVTHREEGLFPLPGEISFKCNCPDSARMCKHIAAVLYGVGARLDDKPELLFALRGVDHEELIAADAENAVSAATSRGKSKRLAESALGDVFGIDLGTDPAPPTANGFNGKANAEATKPSTAKTRAKRTPRTTKKAVPRKVPARKPKAAVKRKVAKASVAHGTAKEKVAKPKKKSAKTASKKAANVGKRRGR